MTNVFYDRIIDFKEYEINLDGNIFQQILETRKNGLDTDRFFLKYVSPEALSKYNFNNIDSVNEFRDVSCSFWGPVKAMSGCNLRPDKLEKGLRYGGIIISDPEKNILGQFDVLDDSIIYSPIFPYFYEERDLIKFANDEYITTISFEELVMNQINYAKRFYVHTGNTKTVVEFRKHGKYIMDEISKSQMIDYLMDRKQGEKVLKKYITR